MNLRNASRKDEGYILVLSIVTTALMLATAIGYMKWAVDERWDSAYEEATVQAYFLAQRGIIEQGLTYLRTRDPGDLPTATVFLPGRVVPDVGSYVNTRVVRVTTLAEGSVFQRSDTYDIYSTGRTSFVDHKNMRDDVTVERTATLRARLRSFANYMYLTNFEKTRFDEVIWFWTPDTLYGRTHSNDYIGLKYSPHFYGPISTSQDHFLEYQASPHFEFEPQFNVPPVYFPTEATAIRNNAQPYVPSRNGELMTWISFTGENGIDIFQYPKGTPRNDSLYEHLNVPNWQAIFVDGDCEVEGRVMGTVTIGCAGNMWLIDDIQYAGTDNRGRWPDESDPVHMLGLVSEGNIIIKDNPANGKENGAGVAPNNLARNSIIINAGMVALGESFTFEHQNDDWELYQGPSPDERGYIYLKGAVTQWRRGYVHRSNHDGTGYGKAYQYDFRFDQRPPPYYLEATDENGKGLFDIISWGEL